MLTEEMKRRYARHLSLENFSEKDQLKLARASVLVVGAGALGSVAATYLAASGIGHISVADFDTVDLSNLQRQVFYSTACLGISKVDVLSEKIKLLNPEVEVETHKIFLKDDEFTRELISNHDIVVEATDNRATKLLMENLALSKSKAIVMGGVSQWQGQIITVVPGHTTFSDIFGDDISCSQFTPCAMAGVLGPVPGVIATLQAIETIKIVTEQGEPLIDRLLVFNALDMSFKTWKIG